MDKDGGGVGGEGGAETIDGAKVKVSRPGDVINVRLKGECTIEDDTQTLNLRGGGD